MAEQNRGMMRREMGGDVPFTSLQRAVNQLFNDFLGRPFESMMGMGPMMESYMPRVDVSEDNEAVYVTAEVPGMDPKDIHVTLHEDLLTIEGEKKREHEEKRVDLYSVERSYGRFRRQVRLPTMVESDKVDARYERGLLTIKANKMTGGRGMKRIEVKGK
jgi:HSP20 family protein